MKDDKAPSRRKTAAPGKQERPAPKSKQAPTKNAAPPTAEVPACEDLRTGLSACTLAHAFLDNLYYQQGRSVELATPNDLYLALAYTVRDRLLHRWIATAHALKHVPARKGVKAVAYMSAEFLIGPQLGSHLLSLGIMDEAREAMASLGFDLDTIAEQEEEPGLGNGGLGRLAACFMDSLAHLEIPAIGYGIRYEFGIFDQEIRDGWQVEVTDKWLRHGNPWEIVRPELAQQAKFGGHTQHWFDQNGRHRVRWIPGWVVKGIPHDTPVPGYGVNICNMYRLWKAEAVESFDFAAFNKGDYFAAVDDKIASENITKVLYPNDETDRGKELRLQQQFFFVSCSLQDMLRIHLASGADIEMFHDGFAVQLNDTHPAIAVAELQRLLVDEHDLEWDDAWAVVTKTFGYTNHTLLPEALERWPLALIGRVLPRHLEIIYEINQRFLKSVAKAFPGDNGKLWRMSLIDETGARSVRMAHLATVGSHSVNGVSALHSELVKTQLLPDFHEMTPAKFINVTNGVAHRRWLALANPALANLVTAAIGPGWTCDATRLRELEAHADDPEFRRQWREVKLGNKRRLADEMRRRANVTADPEALFDVQVKRIHEYKRQHLNLLHILALYNRLRGNPSAQSVPRVFLFGGKAAPGYYMAKLIIKLATSIADMVNADPDTRGLLKAAFIPDFNVKHAQPVYPAADLSEQISTAGKEASGTGNMKFALNGALTIGTADGANIEIRDAVGAENFFEFGLTAEEVVAKRAAGYAPGALVEGNPELRDAIALLSSDELTRGSRGLFQPIVDSLLGGDPFMVLADYESYAECQEKAARCYADRDRWTRMSILNTARMGGFSSDRSIREYCRRIWDANPVHVELENSSRSPCRRHD